MTQEINLAQIAALVAEGERNEGAAALKLVTPAHAREILDGYQQKVTPSGCIELLNLRNGHRSNYAKINLRNTNSRVPGQEGKKIDWQPYGHQLAIIADRGVGELKATSIKPSKTSKTSQKRWKVSHLCHNGACVNAEHLIVESICHRLSLAKPEVATWRP